MYNIDLHYTTCKPYIVKTLELFHFACGACNAGYLTWFVTQAVDSHYKTFYVICVYSRHQWLKSQSIFRMQLTSYPDGWREDIDELLACAASDRYRNTCEFLDLRGLKFSYPNVWVRSMCGSPKNIIDDKYSISSPYIQRYFLTDWIYIQRLIHVLEITFKEVISRWRVK